jgi:hypothetical protein
VSKKPDVIATLTCWRNRKVLLYRSALIGHVIRLHLESAFVVDALKYNFSNPVCVIYNRNYGTENAIYEIPTPGHRWLLVAIKFRKSMPGIKRPSFIKSFYGVNDIPNGKVIWGKKP